MPSQVTLQDIAEATGLSRSAVSLALRGHSRISAGTRQRVLVEMAEKLGYRPNAEIAW
jgi:LacI family transcriptional regulator